MLSCNTYCLTWVSLTLDVAYLFTAAPAKHSCCSLPWKRAIKRKKKQNKTTKKNLLPSVPPGKSSKCILGFKFFPLSTLHISCQSPLGYKISAGKSSPKMASLAYNSCPPTPFLSLEFLFNFCHFNYHMCWCRSVWVYLFVTLYCF